MRWFLLVCFLSALPFTAVTADTLPFDGGSSSTRAELSIPIITNTGAWFPWGSPSSVSLSGIIINSVRILGLSSLPIGENFALRQYQFDNNSTLPAAVITGGTWRADLRIDLDLLGLQEISIGGTLAKDAVTGDILYGVDPSSFVFSDANFEYTWSLLGFTPLDDPDLANPETSLTVPMVPFFPSRNELLVSHISRVALLVPEPGTYLLLGAMVAVGALINRGRVRRAT